MDISLYCTLEYLITLKKLLIVSHCTWNYWSHMEVVNYKNKQFNQNNFNIFITIGRESFVPRFILSGHNRHSTPHVRSGQSEHP